MPATRYRSWQRIVDCKHLPGIPAFMLFQSYCFLPCWPIYFLTSTSPSSRSWRTTKWPIFLWAKQFLGHLSKESSDYALWLNSANASHILFKTPITPGLQRTQKGDILQAQLSTLTRQIQEAGTEVVKATVEAGAASQEFWLLRSNIIPLIDKQLGMNTYIRILLYINPVILATILPL